MQPLHRAALLSLHYRAAILCHRRTLPPLYSAAALCRRAPALWALEAPPDAVRRRVAALRSEADRWAEDRSEAERRSLIARIGRAAVATAAFGASGGSLVAPVLASLGIISGAAPPLGADPPKQRGGS